MPAFFERTTAWLCLAIAVLSAGLPSRGLVLCLEPDGCVSIERLVAGDPCGPCGDHEREAPAPPSGPSADEYGCPCVDLSMPGVAQDRCIAQKTVELRVEACIQARPLQAFQKIALAALAPRALPAVVPRPPESLAFIRSVVLRV